MYARRTYIFSPEQEYNLVNCKAQETFAKNTSSTFSGSLMLNFKKSYLSHFNISRSIVPQMFMKISIKNLNKTSINFQ